MSARERLMLLAEQFSEVGAKDGASIAEVLHTSTKTACDMTCVVTPADEGIVVSEDAVPSDCDPVVREPGSYATATATATASAPASADAHLRPLQAQLTEAEAVALARVRSEAAPVRRVAPLRPAPELRPGKLTSVIRVGGITAYPPPLFDPPATAAPVLAPKKSGGRLRGVSGAERDAARFGDSAGVVAYGLRDVVPVVMAAPPGEVPAVGSPAVAERTSQDAATRPSALGVDQQAAGRTTDRSVASSVEPGMGRPPTPDGLALRVHGEIRALAAALIEVMSGRRPADQVAAYLHPGVRVALGEWLRAPARSRYSGAAVLRRVRLSGTANAVEAMALVQDGPRMRAVAFRFDAVVVPAGGVHGSGRRPRGEVRAEAPRWLCTALQAA
jgi:hypothetical protein